MKDNELHNYNLLFNRIAAGDADAYHSLFKLCYDQLRFNAVKLLKSDYWADEIVQELFLHIWDHRSTLVTIENPAGWLFRVVSNKCFDRTRRQQLELRVQYALQLTSRDQEISLQQNGYDLDLLRKLIREAVDRLPDQQRAVYALKQEEGLSYKEIAERLSISPNTVRNHLNRASQFVRDYIRSNGAFSMLLLYLIYFF